MQLHREELPTVERYYPQSFPSVREADASILLGGGYIHEFVAMIAHEAQGKPVSPCPTSVEQALAERYHTILQQQYRELIAADRHIEVYLPCLAEEWRGRRVRLKAGDANLRMPSRSHIWRG